MTTPNEELRALLADLLAHVDRETCTHEETHRGGAIWTICDSCGKSWADDRGGFVPHEDASPVAAARAALARQEEGREAEWPLFTWSGIAPRKLGALRSQGWSVNGYALYRDGMRGLIDLHGAVHWVGDSQAKHRYWGAGEPDCPKEIKAANGELHTLRCKVCGQDNPKGACPAPPSAGEGDDNWLRHLGALVCASKDRDASREDQEAAIDKAHAALYRAIRRLATPTPQAADTDEWEVRADGQRVRKDRWETGFRNIVSILVGARTEFEIPDIVERVRALTAAGQQAAGVSDAVVERAMRAAAAEHERTPSPIPAGYEPIRRQVRAALEAVWPTAAGAAPEGCITVQRGAVNALLQFGTCHEMSSEAELHTYVEARDLLLNMLAATPNPGAQHGQEGRE